MNKDINLMLFPLVKHGLIQRKIMIIHNCQDINYVIKTVRKKNGGGVAIYITNCSNFTIIDNLTCAVDNVL